MLQVVTSVVEGAQQDGDVGSDELESIMKQVPPGHCYLQLLLSSNCTGW